MFEDYQKAADKAAAEGGAQRPLFGDKQQKYSVYVQKYGLTVQTALTDAREITFQTEVAALKQSKDLYFALGRLGEPTKDFSSGIFSQAMRSVAGTAAGISAGAYQFGKNYAWRVINEIKRNPATNLPKERFTPQLSAERKVSIIESARKNFEAAEKRREAWSLEAEAKLQKWLDNAGLSKTQFDGFAYDFFNVTGSALAAVGAMYITRSPAAVASVFGASQGQQDYNEALRAGIRGDKAMGVGLLNAGVNAALEAVGGEAAIRVITGAAVGKKSLREIFDFAAAKGIKGLALAAGETGLVEGIEEGLQGLAEHGIQNIAGVRNETLTEIAVDSWKQALMGTLGGLTMGGMGRLAAMSAEKFVKAGVPPERAKELADKIIEEAAAPETVEGAIKIINQVDNPLVYAGADPAKAAKEFGDYMRANGFVKGADGKRAPADPEKQARAGKEAYDIGDKVRAVAMAAGKTEADAELAAAGFQSLANWVFENTDVLPAKWFETHKLDIENYVKDNGGATPPQSGTFLQGPRDITQTPAFKKWFGDSKVVDKDGRPLIVYHGSPNKNIEVFSKELSNGQFFFTNIKSLANQYRGGPRKGKVYEAYLNIKNPLEANTLEFLNQYEGHSVNDLKSQGYDGVILDGKSFIVFEPTQIKSVDNRGTLDGDNPNIYFQGAYHGSPYRFDKFSLEHMNTGEGAQAYGWGLYFAGKKEVAEWYRKNLSDTNDGGHTDKPNKFRSTLWDGGYYEYTNAGNRVVNEEDGNEFDINELDKNQADRIGFNLFVENDYDAEEATAAVDELELSAASKKEVKEFIDSLYEMEHGQTYKVEIPEDSEMLLWDKSLNEQPPQIKAALIKVYNELAANPDLKEGFENADYDYANIGTKEWIENGDARDGKEIYEGLVEAGIDPKSLSLKLNEHGIKGIKYLDGSSRGAGEGSYNYVVFDDSAIEILETYYQGENGNPPSPVPSPLKGEGEARGPRGSVTFTPLGALMRLLERADASTFPHELGHIYLRTLQEIYEAARESGATEEFTALWNDITGWIGGMQQIIQNEKGEWIAAPEGYQGKTITGFTTAQHELFANGFLNYVKTGKAPNAKLQSVFEKFKEWLRDLVADAREHVEITPEIQSIFDRLLAGTETECVDAKKYKGKEKDIKALAAKIRAKAKKETTPSADAATPPQEGNDGGLPTINGMDLKQVKALLKQYGARRPSLPRDTLLRALRKQGLTKATAEGFFDAAKVREAGIPIQENGLNESGIIELIQREGYAPAEYAGTYEETAVQQDLAIELAERAIGGEDIYNAEGLERMAEIENFDENIKIIQEAFGGNIRQAEETARAITELEAAGYRVVGNTDIEYVEGETEKLATFAETEEKLKKQVEDLEKQRDEWKEATERRLKEQGKIKAEAEEDAEYANRKARQETVLEPVKKQRAENLKQARRVRNAVIDEINKRELENKEELLKPLREAKEAGEIFEAAGALLEKLEQEYAKTPAGEAERGRLEAPATDWEAKKVSLLKELNEIIAGVDEKTLRAREMLEQESAAKGQLSRNLQRLVFYIQRITIAKFYR